MGGKSSPPPAPDYTPYTQGAQITAQSDLQAAQLQYQLGQQQLALQQQYADRSANTADTYAAMAQDQAAWGQQQYQDIKPYLQSYMNQQLDFQSAATQNEQAQAQYAAQAQAQSQQMYNRYMGTYAPLEDKFAQQAQDYASPQRQDAASAAARGDVATAFQASQDAATRQLQSYGVDPSQGAFRGTQQAMNISRAAALAAAGTQARQQTQQQGLQAELAAIEVGQKLPQNAIQFAQTGTQQATAGLQGSQYGGGGLNTAGNLLTQGTTAMGSPTQYAALSNPYTQLSGVFGSSASGMFGNQISALGGAGQAYNYGGNMLNNMYSNQMEGYKAQAAANAAPWQALGSLAGMGLGGWASGGFKLFGS